MPPLGHPGGGAGPFAGGGVGARGDDDLDGVDAGERGGGGEGGALCVVCCFFGGVGVERVRPRE